MPTPNGERVVAIVLNWMGEALTAACITSLAQQRGVSVDVLLVDNASPDGSGERLRARFPAVHYLETGTNLGYAGGNNVGIEWAIAAGAQWILVINNDTVAAPDCVAELLVASMTDSSIGAVAPLIVRFDDPETIWFAGGKLSRVRAVGVHEHMGARLGELRDLLQTSPVFRPSTFLTGCCVLFRREAVEECGAFRADFFAYVEDVELSTRMARHGWTLGWAPASRLSHHVPPPSAPPSPMQIWLRDRNRRRMVRDTYSRWWRIAFALWFWPTRLVTFLRYAARGDWPRVKGLARGARDQ
jgi:Predicted glycosyltransferases